MFSIHQIKLILPVSDRAMYFVTLCEWIDSATMRFTLYKYQLTMINIE